MGLNRRKISAFTLVELLVVVAILALLISILMPSLNKARERARMAVCKINLKGLGAAFGEYTGANNQWYPAASACGGVVYGDGDGPEYAWDTILYPYYKNFGLIHCPSDKIDRSSFYVDYSVPEERRHPKSYAMNGSVSHFGPSLYGADPDNYPNTNLPYNGSTPPYPWPARIRKMSGVTNPSETVLLADMWDSNYGLSNPPYYHYAPNVYGAYQGSYTGFYNEETNPRAGRTPTYDHRNNDAANFLFCDGSAELLPEKHPKLETDGDCYYYFREKP